MSEQKDAKALVEKLRESALQSYNAFDKQVSDNLLAAANLLEQLGGKAVAIDEMVKWLEEEELFADLQRNEESILGSRIRADRLAQRKNVLSEVLSRARELATPDRKGHYDE